MDTQTTQPAQTAVRSNRYPIVLTGYRNGALTTGHLWDNDCNVFKVIMDTLASIGFAGTIAWWTITTYGQSSRRDSNLSIYDLSHPDKVVQFMDGILDIDRHGRWASWHDEFKAQHRQRVSTAILQGAWLMDKDFHTPEGVVKAGWQLHLPNVQTLAETENIRNSVPRTVEAYINPQAYAREQVG